MPGFAGYMVWIAGALIELLVVIFVIRTGKLRRFWDLSLYFGLEFSLSLLRYLILQHYGLTSPQYIYFYYYSDTLLTVALTLVLLKLFGHVFGLRTWMGMGIPLRIAVPGLAGVALFSYAVVSESPARYMTHFVVECSQNLYFAGLILILVLWAGTIIKNLPLTAEVKLVWLFTIYFGIFTGNYILGNLEPSRYNFIQEATPALAGTLMAAGVLFIVCTEDSHLHVERNR